MLITGTHDTYAFDPDKRVDVVRKNGKFNSTYRGRSQKDGSIVLIKCLNPSRSTDRNLVARFRREFELNIPHPNLLQTIDYVQQDSQHFLIRRYQDGSDLTALAPLPLKEVLRCMKHVLHALEALHTEGIIHCDLRLSNIIRRTNDGGFSVGDLGLAIRKGEADTGNPFALIYSPPEMLLKCPELINETTDLYSLGICAYTLLSGSPPFQHDNPQFMINLQLNTALPPHKRIPAAWMKVLLKASSKHRFPKPPSYYSKAQVADFIRQSQKERFQSASEMIKALESLV